MTRWKRYGNSACLSFNQALVGSVLSLFLLSCNDQDVDTDADRLLTWSIDVTREIEGKVPASSFARLVDVATNGTDMIVALDRDAHELSAFDTSGALSWVVGREGDGPGEFRAPLFVTWDRTGSLIVTDQNRAKISRFGKGGAHIDDIFLPKRDRYVFDVIRDGNSDWYIAAREFGDPASGVLSQQLIRWRGDSIEILDSFDIKMRPSVRVPTCGGASVSGGGLPPLFVPRLLWSSNGAVTAWRGDWAEYRIQVRRADGVTTMLERDLPVTEVTEEMAIEASGGREGKTSSCVYDRLAVIKARGWAERRPLVTGLRVLPSGGLWVSRLDAAADTLIDVFSSAGRYEGTLPAGIALPDAFLGNDLLVYRASLEPGIRANMQPGNRVIRLARVSRR